jgi:hypothetical protein
MPFDFFDPTPEQQNVVLVDAATLREAERLILGYQYLPEEFRSNRGPCRAAALQADTL